MEQERDFGAAVRRLALPVALQSMLQASFSVVDQLMIGRLGSVSVAGVGLAGKFYSIFSVMVSAIAAVAGIMIAQYLGREDGEEARRSFRVNLLLALGAAAGFTGACALAPAGILGLYSADAATVAAGAEYLSVLAGAFAPAACTALLSTLLRCRERPAAPLLAGLAAAALNTALNALLIFGRGGLAPMGAAGAALATVAAQWANALLLAVCLLRRKGLPRRGRAVRQAPFLWRQYAAILLPGLVCEVMWSLGENVYAMIYGRLGTGACAAMTLTGPVQNLAMGALCGFSQAAAILVGKELGAGRYDGAVRAAKKLMRYGLWGSLLLSLLILLLSGRYGALYAVEEEVRRLTGRILLVYALVVPVKVQNMILGGGVLRSGGRTKYVMAVDLAGTWGVGVPLGALAAFGLGLPIPWVYLLLSLEECVRLALSVKIFRGGRWMNRLKG